MTIQTAVNESADLEALVASLAAAEALEKAEEEAAVAAPLSMADELGFDPDELLADLGAPISAEPAAAPAESVAEATQSAEIAEDVLADIESAAARQEAYNKQADTAPIAPAAPAAPAAKKARTPRAPKAPAAPKTPRVAIGSLPDETFEIVIGAPADKAAVLAKTPAQVKVAEKFENLFLALHAGKEPSRYVVSAFKLLKSRQTVNSAEIINAYKVDGLADGTARSQTGQIMALFDTVGIALRASQALTLRSDSAVAAKLSKILSL